MKKVNLSLGGGIDAPIDKTLAATTQGCMPCPTEENLRGFLQGNSPIIDWDIDWKSGFLEDFELCNLQARELLSFALGALKNEVELPYSGLDGCFTVDGWFVVSGTELKYKPDAVLKMKESAYLRMLLRTKPNTFDRKDFRNIRGETNDICLMVSPKDGQTFSHALAAELFNLHISGIGFAYDGNKISAISDYSVRTYWWTALNAAINGRVGFCEHCGKPFATSSERGKPRKYCSDTCRNNHGNKKFRERHRKRKPPRALAPDGSATLK